MNRVVLEHVEARELPERLRGSISLDAKVKITVEEEAPSRRLSVRELREQADRMKADPKFRAVASEEAVARVRALRDEWER